MGTSAYALPPPIAELALASTPSAALLALLQSSQRVGSPSRRQVPLLPPRLLRDSLDDLHRAYNQDQILWKVVQGVNDV